MAVLASCLFFFVLYARLVDVEMTPPGSVLYCPELLADWAVIMHYVPEM